jgi:hypothetical protein
MISLALMLSGRCRVFLLLGKAFSGFWSLKVLVKSSTWQKSSSKFMVSSLAWLSGDFRLLEDTAYPELTLQMALKSRKPAPGLIHHSDRGSQYASERYIRTLEKHGVQISMSRVGMATDNAKIESFFGGFKRECVNLLEFESLADVLSSVPAFLDAVYNEKRLHSSLGYLPPVEFEALIRSESESATVRL